MGVEEHGGGRQLVRLRCYPRPSGIGFAAAALLTLLSLGAALGGAWTAFVVFASCGALLVLRELQECAAATADIQQAVQAPRADEALSPELTPELEQATTGES
jgi:hypothetical protein